MDLTDQTNATKRKPWKTGSHFFTVQENVLTALGQTKCRTDATREADADTKKKHHTSICNNAKEKPPSEPETQPSKSSGTPVSTQQSHARVIKASPTSSAIISQSAIVTAKGKNTNCQCRAIFDTGAQRSFVTEKIVNKLQLEPIREEEIMITTFGQTNEGRNRTYKIVSVTLLSENKSFVLRLNTKRHTFLKK